jgi:hypothetical protein
MFGAPQRASYCYLSTIGPALGLNSWEHRNFVLEHLSNKFRVTEPPESMWIKDRLL